MNNNGIGLHLWSDLLKSYLTNEWLIILKETFIFNPPFLKSLQVLVYLILEIEKFHKNLYLIFIRSSTA